MFEVGDIVEEVGTKEVGTVISITGEGLYPVKVEFENNTRTYTKGGVFDVVVRYNRNWDIKLVKKANINFMSLASILELCHEVKGGDLNKGLLQELVLRAYREGYKHAENDLGE